MVTHALAFPSRRAVAVHVVDAGEAARSLTMSSSSVMFRAIVLIVIVHAVYASGTTFPVPLVLDGIESCARSAVATADSGFETNRDIDYALDGDGDRLVEVDGGVEEERRDEDHFPRLLCAIPCVATRPECTQRIAWELCPLQQLLGVVDCGAALIERYPAWHVAARSGDEPALASGEGDVQCNHVVVMERCTTA